MRRKWTLSDDNQERVGHMAVAAVLLATLLFWGCDVPGYGDEAADASTPEQAVELTPAAYTPPATETAPMVPSPETLAGSSRAVTYEEGTQAFREGRFGEAVEVFAAYTNRNAANPWGHYMLGLSAWKAGDPERAERAFDAALERDPTHLRSLVNLSRVLLQENRATEALEELETALSVDSTSSEVWRLVGVVHADLGRTDDAVDAYRRAIRLNDEDHWAMNNLGFLYISQQRFTDALPPLARAVQLAPSVAPIQNNLGIALERSGYVGSAASAYRAALAANDAHEKARTNLARVEKRGVDLDIEADLDHFAQLFVEEIRQWQVLALEVPSVGEVLPDSLEYPER